MTDLVTRVDAISRKAVAEHAERKKMLREKFPDDARWIDDMRNTFPGCKFKNWTVDGQRIDR